MGADWSLTSVVAVYAVLSAGVVGAVAVLLRLFPPIYGLVVRGEERRQRAVDGARGLCALTVVIHHLLLSMGVPASGPPGQPWREEATRHVVLQMGAIPVAIFFMITAYLFCGRIVRTGGELPAALFLLNRAARIVPLYLVTVGLLVGIAFAHAGWRLVVPPGVLLREIGRFLAFHFVSTYDLNGLPNAIQVVGPIWSLQYEWVFYLCLPVMALLYRGWPSQLVFCAVILLVGRLWSPLFYLFLGGVAGVVFARAGPRTAPLWQIAAILGGVVDVLFFADRPGLITAFLLTPTFVAIVQSHRVVALLGTRPLRYLGEVSYSIYLLHNPLAWAIVLLGVGLDRWQRLSPAAFCLAAWAFLILLVAVATCSFLLVERWGMHRRFSIGARRRGRPVAVA